MTFLGDDIALMNEVFGVLLSELVQFVTPVHRIETTVILVVLLPDIEAKSYVAQVLRQLQAFDGGSKRADSSEVVGHIKPKTKRSIAALRDTRQIDTVGVSFPLEYRYLISSAEGNTLWKKVPPTLAVIGHTWHEVERRRIPIAIGEGHQSVPLLLVDFGRPRSFLVGVTTATVQVDEERIAPFRLSAFSKESILHLLPLRKFPNEWIVRINPPQVGGEARAVGTMPEFPHLLLLSRVTLGRAVLRVESLGGLLGMLSFYLLTEVAHECAITHVCRGSRRWLVLLASEETESDGAECER